MMTSKPEKVQAVQRMGVSGGPEWGTEYFRQKQLQAYTSEKQTADCKVRKRKRSLESTQKQAVGPHGRASTAPQTR